MLVKYVKYLVFFTKIFLFSIGAASHSTYAAFIDFNDLELPEMHSWECYIEWLPCVHDLNDEYASKGVIFSGDRDWFWGYELADGSYEMSVTGYNYIGISFIGTLPNFVSFNIDSPTKGEASFIKGYGENGALLFTEITNGWRGYDSNSTPYIPNELVSIQSDEPIHRLGITSFYGLRIGPTIDNLTFEYRSVPEPSPLLLGALGLCGILWRRRTARIDIDK
jgi:hypothetical protein